ncbi:sodium:solute symporter family protein [Inhella sp.]|uniref:sodium:solute symporter family protein n=1 Tax=Inhella sp. TaxID=1921806 RepID=UPI0035B0B765
MLITFVAVYLLITIGIGLLAARRVHNAKDYLVAGRSLPLYMNVATVFATWFGAETVLAVSATFAMDGLSGIPGDPFGATAALMLAALLFARLFYRLNLLTIGDFYKKRYGRTVEVFTSLAIALSYLGWSAAQMTALGLVIQVLSGGALELNQAILIGASVVLIYTLFGGMWSVAFTDLFQTVIIVIGLSLVAGLVAQMAGGFDVVWSHAVEAGKLNLVPPEADGAAILALLAAFLTVAFGSVPQQDVFQRMTSAKDEKTAVRGTVIGALAYFMFAFIPIFIAYAALVMDPSLSALFGDEDGRVVQRILPDLVLSKMPMWAQVMFFGALLSAILSTASGTLLAPTATFTENVIKPFAPHLNDKQFLLLLRVVLVCFTLGVLVFALNSRSTMYEMVLNAYKVTLVAAFVPLFAGAFWKRANTQGALASIVLGLTAWITAEFTAADALIPPQLVGFAFSLLGMLLGTLAPTVIKPAGHSIAAAIAAEERAAARHAHH